MKRKKFIALLCVAATSASLVTPVMAEENQAVETVQETAVEQETTGQETPAEETVETELSETEETTAPEEAAPAEDQVPATDAEQTAPEDAEVKDGFVEEDGKVYYYEKGSLVTNRIIDFEEEDGTTYACYFQEDGSMMINKSHWVTEGPFRSGYIRADENGHLITGWYEISAESTPYGKVLYEYYDSDCFQVTNGIVEVNGNKYYLGSNGYLVTDSQVVFEGKLYKADADGVLTESEVTEKEQWVEAEYQWYLYVDGKLIKNQYYTTYEGDTYYFNDSGVMQTGVFWDKDREEKLADRNGIVFVNPAKGWNQSKDGKLWYYFKEENGGLHPAHGEVVTTSDGKKYAFDYDGVMLKGNGTYWFDNEPCRYLTNDSGVIQESNGWVKYDGNWYYWKDGDTINRGIHTIDGKDYYFENDILRVGRIEVHDSNKLYLTDSSGALINTPGWNKYKNNWYYMNADGSVRKNEFIKYGNDLYYVDSEGKMLTGDFHFNGNSYHTDSDGVILKNAWYQEGYDWYYAGEDGAFLTYSWKSGAGGVWYYLNESGAMAKGMCWVCNKDDYENGKYEYFDDNGIWQENNRINKNGWSLVDGKWYYYSEGNPYTGWVGSYYISQGVMCTNTYIEGNNVDYYVDHEGVYQRNSWVKIPGYGGAGWRYAGTDGKILKNVWVGDYYIDGSGYMVSNRIVDTGYYGLCKFADDGKFIGYVKKSDWNKAGDKWYYADSNGALLKGRQVIGGKTYYFEEWNYEMYANTIVYDDVDHKYVFVGSDGAVSKANGWQLGESGQWYYLENGIPKTGWLNYGGKRYYLSPWTFTGYRDVWDEDTGEREYYFFDQDGAVCEPNDGWFSVKSDGQTYWYYIKNGEPVRDGWYNGHRFRWDGEMITGSIWTDADEIYVYDDNGYLLKNGWHKLHGDWYYTDAKGRAYTGERKINGTKYWFTDEGVWVK